MPENNEFDEFVSRAISDLEAAQGLLASKYNLGSLDEWKLDQESRTLTFLLNDEVNVVCEVAAIGSLSSGNWMWAWANNSLNLGIKLESEVLKSLSEKPALTRSANLLFMLMRIWRGNLSQWQ